MTVNYGSNEKLDAWLRSIVYPLGVAVLVTSLIDLLVSRLLFRAGPDVLAHTDAVSVVYFAIIGRIAVNLEQFLIFAFIGIAAFLLLLQAEQVPRILGILLVTMIACGGVLYAPLATETSWAVSTLLILLGAAIVPVLAYQYLSTHGGLSGRLRLTFAAFLLCLVLSFLLPLYYRMYLLLGAAGVASLPYPVEVYLAGVFAVMATTLAAFAYAVQAPSTGFGFGPRNVLKVTVLPTLLVAPVLYEFLRSFFAVQVFGLVLTMSTDIAVSHDLIKAIVVVFWFLLTAVLLLFLKGRHSSNRMLVQQGMGLVLLMSTTMLFNYPYYLMLGISGALLLTYPITAGSRELVLPDAQQLTRKS